MHCRYGFYGYGHGYNFRLVVNSRRIVIKEAKAAMQAAQASRSKTSNRKGALLGDFIVWEQLGVGSTSKTYLASKRSNPKQKVVIKAVNSKHRKIVLHEFEILRKLRHENIVLMYQKVFLPDIGQDLLIMEHIPGLELYEFLERIIHLSERVVSSIMLQLADAVAYIHALGIMHRDIKMENIIISQSGASGYKITLIDFGLATAAATSTRFCGSLYYIAPEIAKVRKDRAYDKKVDVWSMGVVAFALCAGFLPFCFDDSSDTLKAICCDCLLFPFWVGKSLVRAIQAMLEQDLQERISSVEVFQEFKDLVSYYKKRKNFTVPPSNRARELTMKENIRNQRASFHIKKRIQTRNGTSVRIAPGKIDRSSWTPSPKTSSRSRIETVKNEKKSNESTVSARSSWTPSPKANEKLRLKTLKSKEKSGDNKVSLRPLRSSLPSPLSRRKNQLRNDNNNNNNNKTIDRETLQRSTKPSNVPSPISTKNSREALPCPTRPINSPVQLNHLKHAWSRKQAEESPRDHIRSKGMILHRNKQHEQKEQVGESPRRVAITQPRAKGNNMSPRHVEESTRDHIRNIGMILHRKKQHGQKNVKKLPRRSRPSTPTQSQSNPKSKGHLAPLFDKKKANR